MENKNIHLINIATPFRLGYADMHRPPAGILYVGGFLQQNGYNVIIHYIQKKDIENIAQQIAKDKNTLFAGFSVKTGKQISLSAQMSIEIKNINKDINIVWGGIHPSLVPQDCLKYWFVDFVVVGEGETTAFELAECLYKSKQFSNIKGLGYKSENNVIINEERPFEKNIDIFKQAWDLTNPQNFVSNYRKNVNSFCYITSRGCPHSCGFCYNLEFNKRRWRCHSVDYVISEIKKLKEKVDIHEISFDDDNFFTNRTRGLQILQELKKMNITCSWLELRIDYINDEILKQITELGVKSIFTGWESGSPETLQKISKGFTPELILEKFKILSKYKNLIVDASAIIGFPWETKKNYYETINLALKMFNVMKYRINFNIGIYIPYPKTPISIEAEKKGFRFPENYEGWWKYDILNGEMELPWMPNNKVKHYTIIDKYFKLLYVSPYINFPLKQIAKILAHISYFRLKTKFVFFPFEIWITDIIKKRYFKQLSN